MQAYLGMITPFGFNFAPRGWMLCQGQILPITSNTALFSLLGTTFGGNGTTTFQLPDLRGRTAIGQGQGPGLSVYDIGDQVGAETEQLTINELPTHIHTATANSTSTSTSASTLNGENAAGSGALPANKVLAGGSAGVMLYAAPGSGNVKAMASESIATTTTTTTNTTATVNPAGNGLPFGILQPSLCVNYAICVSGIFPSRN